MLLELCVYDWDENIDDLAKFKKIFLVTEIGVEDPINVIDNKEYYLYILKGMCDGVHAFIDFLDPVADSLIGDERDEGKLKEYIYKKGKLEFDIETPGYYYTSEIDENNFLALDMESFRVINE